MVTVKIATLADVRVADLDNGSMIMALTDDAGVDYIHTYDDMGQLAEDLLVYADNPIGSRTVDDWEGNEIADHQWRNDLDDSDIIAAGGTFYGRGCAYTELIVALVAKMHGDWVTS